MAKNFADSFTEVPGRALNISTRRLLSLFLTPKSVLHTGDWQHLAEYFGFDFMAIRYLDGYKDPVNELLDLWIDKKGNKATIGQLLNGLATIGRLDILGQIPVYLEKDVSSYYKHLEEEQRLLEKLYPVQDPAVSTACDSDEETLTIDDGRIYDAFVCFAAHDLPFVKEMIKILESDKYRLKLCINVRDLLPGKSRDKTITKIIEEKCRRFIIILTPEFLASRECKFQVEFALGLSIDKERDKSKIIPILLRQCEVPRILRFITACDYTKADVREWFWDRVVAALKAPLPKEKKSIGKEELSRSSSLPSISLQSKLNSLKDQFSCKRANCDSSEEDIKSNALMSDITIGSSSEEHNPDCASTSSYSSHSCLMSDYSEHSSASSARDSMQTASCSTSSDSHLIKQTKNDLKHLKSNGFSFFRKKKCAL